MKNIMLVCAQGMSTSLLVKKMEKAAKELNIDANIWAIGNLSVQDEFKKADIILLGPQIRFRKKDIEQQINKHCPVEAIDMIDYGMANGEAILKKALNIIDEKQ